MKIVPKRKLHYPFAMECDYTKLLTGYVKDCMAVVRSYIPEMRKLVTEQSAPGATSVNVYLALLIDRIRHDMPQAEVLEGRMRHFFDDVAHFTWRDLKRLLESVTGTQISDVGARLPRKDADDDLDALKELWVGENLDLIRSIDDETMRRIRQILTAHITGSVNHAGLAKDLIAEIQAITEKEKRRAELIARDQLGKLHGQINRRKQESLGIDEYEWETSHDERVRDSHRELQGKVFSWNKPPPEGHPGYPIRCRCIALPVIDWDRQLGEPKKGSYEEVNDDVIQNYKPVLTDDNAKETVSRGAIKIHGKRLIGTVNKLYLSDMAHLKPREMHFIDQCLTDALKVLGITDEMNLPKIMIVAATEMRNGALACYLPARNVLFILDALGNKNTLLELQKDGACPNNPLSTFVHEMLHWLDAEAYRKKHGKIDSDYMKQLRVLAKVKIDKLTPEEYTKLSEYAKMQIALGLYDEAFVEQRVYGLLRGRR